METTLSVICENSVGRAIPALGEHGFACLIERDATTVLVDCGQGFGIERNARVLGKDLRSLDAVVLSHGHYDHVGGLEQVLAYTGVIDIFAHPEIFVPRYSRSEYALRFIGIPQRRELLETLGARFAWTPKFCEVAPGIHVTGQVQRRTTYEQGAPELVVPEADGTFTPDPFNDDMGIVVECKQGLAVILGCAHAGMINILLQVQEHFPTQKIHAVLGGPIWVRLHRRSLTSPCGIWSSLISSTSGYPTAPGRIVQLRSASAWGRGFSLLLSGRSFNSSPGANSTTSRRCKMRYLHITGIVLLILLAGCASRTSSQVYSRDQAQRQMSVYYGTVLAVSPVIIEGTQSGAGPIAGGVVGGIAGNTVGGGHGRALATAAGVIGGALLGSAVEEGATRTDGLEITVELDNGEIIAVVQAADVPFYVGDRVRIVRGAGGMMRVRQ